MIREAKHPGYSHLLVDGTNLVHRPWFVRELREDPDSIDPAEVADTFVRMIANWQRDLGLRDSRVVVAFDSPGSSGRKELYGEYKAGRSKRHDGLAACLRLAPEVAARHGFTTLEVGGYEADDIIATYARLLARDGLPHATLSSDKDLLQIAGPATHPIVLGHKAGEYTIWGEGLVRERYGFAPPLMADYKALMGDKSDNIPGVRGIGEVAAKHLLGGLGDLHAVYAALDVWFADQRTVPHDALTKSVRRYLFEGRDDAFLYLALTRLNDRVPGL